MERSPRHHRLLQPEPVEDRKYEGKCPLSGLPEDAKTLFKMTLSFAEIAPAVEWYGQAQVIRGLAVHKWPLVEFPPRCW